MKARKRLSNNFLFLALVLSLIGLAKNQKLQAQVVYDESIITNADDRKPTDNKEKYPKKIEGQFEAQGFGKDFSKPPAPVNPAPENSETEKSKIDNSNLENKNLQNQKIENTTNKNNNLNIPNPDLNSKSNPNSNQDSGPNSNPDLKDSKIETNNKSSNSSDPKSVKSDKKETKSISDKNSLPDSQDKKTLNTQDKDLTDSTDKELSDAEDKKPSDAKDKENSDVKDKEISDSKVQKNSNTQDQKLSVPQDKNIKDAKDDKGITTDTSPVDPKTIPALTEAEIQNQLQLQRRVDVFYEGRVRFKNGAAIWATEDAGSVTPKLEITAPEFVDLSQESIRFMVYSNYFPFIKKWELRIYQMNRINGQEEVATLKGTRDSLYNIEYKFEKGRFKDADILYYQLKVFQDDKIFDIVRPKQLTFIKRPLNQDLQEQDKNIQSKQLLKIWGENAIEMQNIPIRGSRVRLVGSNIPINYILNYRGQNIQVDNDGRFVIEEHFPVGEHDIVIDISEAKTTTPREFVTKAETDLEEKFSIPFKVKVSGEYLFYLAMADFRVGENKLSQKVVGVGNDNEFGETFLDGRLAFYLKGKVLGKYLVTAQMDTTEGPIENMFDGLHRKNAESLFRRLDPDRYYPVYGDNSNTYEDAPSAGRLFVRVELDESYAMWGNDNTNMTRTLLSQYNRTLYGAHFKYKSRVATKYAQRKTEVKAFASQPETLLGHNEFLATGGRQYILRNNDVVQGSEKVVLEIRDRDVLTAPKRTVVLKPFQDYEFDYLAGRIVLTQALATFAGIDNSQIIDNNTVGSDLYYLVVDYEYNPTGNNLDQTSFGLSGNQWLSDYVSVGGTYVSEKRAADEYTLKGVDASLRVGKDSYVKVERSETENVQSLNNFLSQDGGLSFVQKPQTLNSPGESAAAWSVESQVHLSDFMNTKDDAILSTWYRDYEAGYSTARLQAQNNLTEFGYNLDYRFLGRNIFKTKMTNLEETSVRKDKMFLVSLGREFTTGSTVSVEYRQDNIQNLATTNDGRGEVVGILVNQRITPAINIYGKAQTSLTEDGIYTSNDRWALGTKFRMGAKWDGLAEYSDGDRGDGSIVGVGYNLDATHKVYGNFDKSVDSTTGLQSNGFTLGQRKRFNEGYSLTAENGFDTVGESAGIKQLYGLDYNVNRVLTTGVSVQFGDLEDRLTGNLTSKDAVSANLTYTRNQDLLASTKISFVNQRGAVNLDQILLTNSLRFRTGPAHTWSLKADYSFSEDPNFAEPLARYFEGNLGYGFRPVSNNRLNGFFRYTYLYDLDSQAQVNARNDQRVNILSGEMSYDVTRRWEIGGRLAQKIGSERINRGTGPWIDATLTFAQIRARYHLIRKWDGVFEFRAVNVRENQDLQSGFLLGMDYHLGENLKLGGGFNFTRFNDDMTNFNFDNYGWFINIIGKM